VPEMTDNEKLRRTLIRALAILGDADALEATANDDVLEEALAYADEVRGYRWLGLNGEKRDTAIMVAQIIGDNFDNIINRRKLGGQNEG